MTSVRIVLLVAGLVTASLAGQSRFPSWPVDEAPQGIRPVISRADLVIADMQSAVLRELNDVLQKGGAVAAIGFCHLDATAMTQRLEKHSAIAAGRTSDRLRNPANAPRDWAAPFVGAHGGKPASAVKGFAVDLGDRIGVLRPIVEQPMCAGCHGPQDQLAAGVRTVLRNRYPADRALGFTDGEIRGWFWVEMPKR
jgi:hypothetical protein